MLAVGSTLGSRTRRSYKYKGRYTDDVCTLTNLALLFCAATALTLLIYVCLPLLSLSGGIDIEPERGDSGYDPSQPLSAENKLKVAVCVLITKEPDAKGGFLDAAATLAYSIEAAQSIHDLTLVALVHEAVSERTTDIMELVGFTVVRQDVPIRNEEIRNEVIREQILKDGCCGMLELLKLWVWTWLEYDVVMSLDADMLFHGNFDQIFRVLYKEEDTAEMEVLRVADKYPPKDESVVLPPIDDWEPFTLAWTHGASAERGNELMNGGFLIVRPNIVDFQNILEIVRCVLGVTHIYSCVIV